MSEWSRPIENSVEVIMGQRRRGGGGRTTTKKPPSGRTAARAVAQANAQGATLGRNHLSMGAGVLCAIEAVYGLSSLAIRIGDYPNALPALLGWVLFLGAFSAMTLAVATGGDRLPPWAFFAYVSALAGVVALDFVAIWPLGDIGYATASVTAGFGLMAAVTMRPARDLAIATLVLLAAFLAAIVLSVPLTPELAPTQIVTVSVAVVTPMLGIVVVHRFRRMLRLALDRVLIQSTVSAPRFAVGMLASEELARLDLAAEELLDSVASGRTALPLAPKVASTAASLATELRLHLIEGRRETWLYHAVAESEQLGKSMTLTDTGSLAGLLDPHQRDGLLSAVWLLVADATTIRTAQLVVGPVVPVATPGPRGTITIPIVITTTGVARGRVDPSIWPALAQVGTYSHSAEASSLRVDIECIVANPADR